MNQETLLLDFSREPPGHTCEAGALADAWDSYKERHDPPMVIIAVDGSLFQCWPCDMFDNREAAWSWYQRFVRAVRAR